MSNSSRKRRRIEAWTGKECPPPYGDPAIESVQWFRMEAGEEDRANDDDPYRDLRVRFEKVAGQWICNGLLVATAGELTNTELSQRLPFPDLVQVGFEFLEMFNGAPPPRKRVQRGRGRGGSPEAFYEEVARQYIFATHHPDRSVRRAPMKWLRDQQQFWEDDRPPHADTVRSWRRKCVVKGLLTEDGLPGPKLSGGDDDEGSTS